MALLAMTATGALAFDSAPGETSEARLETLMHWLPGDYGNRAFVTQLPDAGAVPDGDDRSPVITTFIRPVRMPALADHLLYVEEYRGTDERRLERVRLYALSTGATPGTVDMLVINPRNPDALRGAYADLARVQALSAADLLADSPGCRLGFTAGAGGAIIGRMAYQGCRFGDQWVDYEIHVRPGGHWVCYSRRGQTDDAIRWQLTPGFPCIYMARQ